MYFFRVPSTKFRDEESGLLYYGFRFYNSTVGRWISRDPVAERGGLNLYGFVNNQPTVQIDVLGATPQGIAIVSLVVAIVNVVHNLTNGAVVSGGTIAFSQKPWGDIWNKESVNSLSINGIAGRDDSLSSRRYCPRFDDELTVTMNRSISHAWGWNLDATLAVSMHFTLPAGGGFAARFDANDSTHEGADISFVFTGITVTMSQKTADCECVIEYPCATRDSCN
ncbi:MAG: RHS repeat-associated core domain-containing protein [Verrucomicrobiales bacterium]